MNWARLPWSVISRSVVVTVVTTKKNQPARDFLERVAAPFREEIENGTATLFLQRLLRRASLVTPLSSA